jgi:hypothetical protein
MNPDSITLETMTTAAGAGARAGPSTRAAREELSVCEVAAVLDVSPGRVQQLVRYSSARGGTQRTPFRVQFALQRGLPAAALVVGFDGPRPAEQEAAEYQQDHGYYDRQNQHGHQQTRPGAAIVKMRKSVENLL